MKSKTLFLSGVLILLGLLILIGDPGLLCSNEPAVDDETQSIWIPADPADWSPSGRDMINERIWETKNELAALSGELTSSRIQDIKDFFQFSRDWITGIDGKKLPSAAIQGYLTSHQSDIASIKIELVWFIAEENIFNARLPKNKQNDDDVLHYLQYGFKLTYVLTDGTIIDPPGSRDERHIRSCDWDQGG